jgi:hypothetical protein
VAKPKNGQAGLAKELSEVIGQMQVLEERLKIAEAKLVAIIKQDVEALDTYAREN